jgi:hypothetical protein
MIRDTLIIKKVKAPGTADFKVTVAALGLSEPDRLRVNAIILLETKSSAGVAKAMTGAAAAWSDSGANLAITKATGQAQDDVYTIGLAIGMTEAVVAGT